MIRELLVNSILLLTKIHDKFFTLSASSIKSEDATQEDESWIIVYIKGSKTHISHFWGTANGIMRTFNKMGIDPSKYAYISLSEIIKVVEHQNASEN